MKQNVEINIILMMKGLGFGSMHSLSIIQSFKSCPVYFIGNGPFCLISLNHKHFYEWLLCHTSSTFFVASEEVKFTDVRSSKIYVALQFCR